MNAPLANLPTVIYQFAMSPYDDWRSLAWGGALLVTFSVLLLNILSRTVFSTEKHQLKSHHDPSYEPNAYPDSNRHAKEQDH